MSKFWRPVRKLNPADNAFRTGPRHDIVAAKSVQIGNKPAGAYFTRFAGFVILNDHPVKHDRKRS